MSVTYKDIDLLSQKSSVAGTEKLPVSDTEYITPAQISAKTASDLDAENLVYLGPEAEDYVDGSEPVDVSTKEDKTNKVTSLSSSSTDTEYPSAKCVYDLVGDIETLLAAL